MRTKRGLDRTTVLFAPETVTPIHIKSTQDGLKRKAPRRVEVAPYTWLEPKPCDAHLTDEQIRQRFAERRKQVWKR